MKVNICIFILIVFTFIGCEYTNYQQGKELFETNCGSCHMKDGSGVSKLYPALNNLQSSNINVKSIPCTIRYGLERDDSLIAMIGLPHLSEVEINNIVNYLINDMNKMNLELTIDETDSYLKNCK